MKKAIIKGICAVILGATLGSATPAEAFRIASITARETATLEADARSVGELKNAIEKGDAYAAVLLGDRYFSGLGVERDLELGFAAYRKAIELGWGTEPTEAAEAAFTLAEAYDYGWGVEENKEKALEFYRKAAKLGHVNSVNVVSVREEKWGTAKTLEFLCDVALAGNADAACNLAARYAQGDGVEQSAEKCREWYLKGIELGSAERRALARTGEEGRKQPKILRGGSTRRGKRERVGGGMVGLSISKRQRRLRRRQRPGEGRRIGKPLRRGDERRAVGD